MEQYFEAIAEQMEGYDEFEKEAWSFKVCFNSVDYYFVTDSAV